MSDENLYDYWATRSEEYWKERSRKALGDEYTELVELRDNMLNFEDLNTGYVLRLIADRLESPVHRDIMLASANYLRRLARKIDEVDPLKGAKANDGKQETMEGEVQGEGCEVRRD